MENSPAIWAVGARPRTLPAAVAPVIAGVASAATVDEYHWWVALGCLVVALALQVGVNYANDYSDGVRGTDDERVGPTRLVASGLASPRAVKTAAFLSFGVAAVAGLAVVALSGHWWLLGVGALSVLAAWYYTGGAKPYGYLGLGELMVFIFFGLVATVGTTYVIAGTAPAQAWLAATAVGVLASGILVANNLRDIATDSVVGKMTLPVRLGDRNTRLFYAALCAVAALAVVGYAALTSWWALLGLLGVVLILPGLKLVLGGATGRDLIPVIQSTGMAEVALSMGLLAAAFLA
ncbi:1,4-dihydroxy-2-naphthoate polyprenyltransferase [Tessaracoccus flavus]|uniref:1,4-dihydroxy-2-naphthoate octaprenyltransferase n=1 Tax=Tessaracoccus flavus TaxID=1610493 RepID=A0A1Q2CCJ6_9ACTN|nr:1,4-dihydroxy-2-naphthoate polyprenyltransferase [Tessaracoccus flavus]AQP43838.1 1,4-dihydroxy-2-naphthoate polyprenyltransferase [Tessaracoccus flavus]SDY25714.1 1,4-dihydroxy-2-naphthoate prenyltransferase [Tessaracoccus flavus]